MLVMVINLINMVTINKCFQHHVPLENDFFGAMATGKIGSRW